MATVTLTFNRDEVLKILKAHVEQEYKRKVTKSEINVHIEVPDRGGGSYAEFQNIEIELGDKLTTHNQFSQHDR